MMRCSRFLERISGERKLESIADSDPLVEPSNQLL